MLNNQLLAVVELGSMGINLKIARVQEGRFDCIETLRSPLALGIDAYNHSMIAAETIDKLCNVLQGFVFKIKEYRIPQEACFVFATSALREALNREVALHRVFQATGFKVEIFENLKERSLMLDALRSFQLNFQTLSEEGLTVLDIGAGSLQVSLFSEGACYLTQNYLLGGLRMRELFSSFETEAFSRNVLIETYIRAELRHFRGLNPQEIKEPHLTVMAAEIPYLLKIANKNNSSLAFFSKEEFFNLYERIILEGPLKLSTDYAVPSHLVDQMIPVLTLIREYLNHIDCDGIHLLNLDLCDAVLQSLAVASFEASKCSDATKKNLLATSKFMARSFQVDEAHSCFVDKVSQMLLASLDKRMDFHENDSLVLSMVSYLHAIGRFLNLKKPEENSYHILKETEFLGLDDDDKVLLLTLVRLYFKQTMPRPEMLQACSEAVQQRVLSLLSLLRLAEALDVSRTQSVQIEGIVVKKKSCILTLHFSQDSTLERWAIDQNKELFELYFGLKLKIETKKF